jgi:hypothetical protein
MSFRNQGQFEEFLGKKLEKIARQFSKEAEGVFRNQIEKLNRAFLTSSAFKEIKGSLAGEYGFTRSEIAELDSIIEAMTRVSSEESKDYSFVIQYVDLKALHAQPEAQHDLTSSDGSDTISWSRWLEEGATVAGFSYARDGGKGSRSGKGTMKEGGTWVLRPARGFTSLRKNLDLDKIKKDLSLVVKRVRKKV